MKLILFPSSMILNPSEDIVVFFDLNKDFSSLKAVCFFLSKVTLSDNKLKLSDLNFTFFLKSILSFFKKLPSLAVTKIFSNYC